MAVLRLATILLVLLAGCYAPDLADCNVTCASDEDCAGDQVCTERGLCAGAASACDEPSATVDAGSSGRTISVRVNIMGDGSITVAGQTCTRAMGMDSCTFEVPAGELAFTATPTRTDKPFERWTSLVCAGQSAECSASVWINATVSAKFR